MDCLSVKKLTGAIADGEYSMRIFGRDNSETQVTVYCHGMRSNEPKEFLTLPSGVSHNYVTITKDAQCNYSQDKGMYDHGIFI